LVRRPEIHQAACQRVERAAADLGFRHRCDRKPHPRRRREQGVPALCPPLVPSAFVPSRIRRKGSPSVPASARVATRALDRGALRHGDGRLRAGGAGLAPLVTFRRGLRPGDRARRRMARCFPPPALSASWRFRCLPSTWAAWDSSPPIHNRRDLSRAGARFSRRTPQSPGASCSPPKWCAATEVVGVLPGA